MLNNKKIKAKKVGVGLVGERMVGGKECGGVKGGCVGREGEVGGGGSATPVENSRLIGDPPVNKKREINIYTIAIARVSAL